MPETTSGHPYDPVFGLRGKLLLPPILFALLCTHWETERHWLAFGAGGAVFALGLVLRIWSQMHLRYRLAGSMVLTMTGPYARVRNPLYIGNTLIVVGLSIGSELLWFAPGALLWCGLLYYFVTRYEESLLTGLYGAPYTEYCERVPRFLPRLSLPADQAASEARQYLVPSLRVELLRNLLLWVPFVVKGFIA